MTTVVIGAGTPNARFVWTADRPINITFSIQGPDALGWTPPSIAIVQHYDPYQNITVAEQFSIGGFGPNQITITTGSLAALGTGEVVVTVVDNPDFTIPTGGVDIRSLPSPIRLLLQSLSVVDDVVGGILSSTGYAVTQTSVENATDFYLEFGHTYAPGVLEAQGIRPELLPSFLAPVFDVNGNLVGVNGLAPCFSAGTPILLADGRRVAIEDIRAGMRVAAFDETAAGTGPLHAGRVTRLIPGITTEWIVLDDGTRVTPGHRYLTERGTWMSAADHIASDGLVVDAATNDNAGAFRMRVVQAGGGV